MAQRSPCGPAGACHSSAAHRPWWSRMLGRRSVMMRPRLSTAVSISRPMPANRAGQLLGARLHPLLEFVARPAQQFFGQLALGDVDEGGHRALHHAAVQDRVRRVFGAERGAVGTPQYLAVDAAGQALAKGVEDRAVGLGIDAAVAVGVVHQPVHVAAQHLFGSPAQHLRTSTVDEGAAALQVDAEDALAGRLQQQPQPRRPGGSRLVRCVCGVDHR